MRLIKKPSIILTPINSIVILLLLVTFLKGLVWSTSIPIWHAPDEAAHFAKVQTQGEDIKIKLSNEKDHSLELLLSERILETERDENGNNKFTYHPEYKITYTDSTIGKYENEIKNFPNSYRKEMVKKESASYPFLYYFIGGLFYKIVYNSDLFVRVFAVRIFSILSLVLMTFFSYKSGLILFSKNKTKALSLAVLVSFQPMITFTSSGVNSDNLGNLIFTFVIYCLLQIIDTKPTVFKTVLVSIVLGLGLQTKPQVLALFPVLLLMPIFVNRKFVLKTIFMIIICITSALFLSKSEVLFRARNNWVENRVPLPYIEISKESSVDKITFPEYLNFTLRHTISEVIPWYWGVFDWLGVVLPRVVNRILMRVLGLSCIGVVLYILKCILKRDWSKTTRVHFFMILIALEYFAVITYWDFNHYKTKGFSIGIQGRYFLPVVLSQMAILMLGVENLVSTVLKLLSKVKKISFNEVMVSNWVSKSLAFFMVGLNFIALSTLINSYYSTSKLTVFLNQISQYKPDAFKGPSIVLIFLLYIFTLVIFLWKNIRRY